jgi:D-tyrosyl-tRNA(Tyr) deacylase
VTAEGRVTGAIAKGYLLLVGFGHGDGDEQIQWMAEKVKGLRLFPDDEGKMNRDLEAVNGAVLVVSQFTLYGDARKGRRPSFVGAAAPDEAERLYHAYCGALAALDVPVERGVFGAMMDVELVNDGPVTLILDR